MRILSIDFDYFIDATIEDRELYFPDGHDNLSPQMTKFLWDRCYSYYEDLKNIGVIEDFYTMCEFLSKMVGGKVLLADSHKEIRYLFDSIQEEEDFEVINIDFHHDMYVTGGDTLDCGNWLRFLVDLKPDAKITWVRREDSQVESLSGTFPYYHTTDITEVQGEFDYIFLCFSSPWTPPHLMTKFTEMCWCTPS